MRWSIVVPLGLTLLLARAVSAQTTGSMAGTVTLFETAFETRPSIQIYDATGALVQTVSLGQTDRVRASSTDTVPWTASGLAPGRYYVRTSNPISPLGFHVVFLSGFWVDELFDNIPCVSDDCNPLSGTPVMVTAGQTTSGINITLDVGASISGGATTTSLGARGYDIFDSRGVPLSNRISSDPFGGGFVAEGLPAGTYYLLAHRDLFGSEPETLYANSPCDGCAVTSGTPVTVALGENKTGINVGQPPSGTISGTVRSDGSANPPNTPLNGVKVSVYALNGALVTSVTTASDGTYSIGALVPGPYFLKASNIQGFVDQLYNSSSCTGCNPTTGTPVSVIAGNTTSGIDFSLATGTVVTGTVAAATGGPLFPPVVIYALSPDLPTARVVPVSQVSPGPPVTFFAVYSATVPQGSYFVQTDPLPGFGQQLYNGVACPQGICPTAFATAVTVGGSAVTGINFGLPACTASTIAPITLATAAVGVAYRQTLLASGANGPVRFVVSAGTLPPGLSLDPDTGALSGTPTTSGHFTFTVSAVDMAACAGSRAYTLDIPSCVINSGFLGFTTTVPAQAGGWIIPYTTTCSSLTATANVPWITSLSAANGTVSYTTAQNTGGTRQGAIALGPRVFTVIQTGVSDLPPFGSVDAPEDGAIVSGSIGISGWALDDHFVSQVSIWRDPVTGEPAQQVFIGFATFVTGARPDVATAFPTLPFNERAGWGYLLLTNMLPNHGNGTFRILVYATDVQVGTGAPSTSQRTLIGTKIINAVNASATAPFGAIDTPDQGATVSGTSYVNFGWALTPQPKMIPFDGSTIHVLIDGVDVGTVAAYNLFRPDVSGLFPGLKNSGGPVGYRVIDTTALSEGTHTIAWIATDDGGMTTGIGSRYFTVSNSAWQPSLRANFAAAPPAVTDSELAQATVTHIRSDRSTAQTSEGQPFAPDRSRAVPARVDGVDFGRNAGSLASLPVDATGVRTVTLSNLQGLVLSLSAGAEGPAYKDSPSVVGRFFRPHETDCAATYAGYLVVNGELRALPVGSSLDPAGTFYWHPGPGFFGMYRLLFVRTACDRAQQRIPVSVTIR